jgi:hypothetical protein
MLLFQRSPSSSYLSLPPLRTNTRSSTSSVLVGDSAAGSRKPAGSTLALAMATCEGRERHHRVHTMQKLHSVHMCLHPLRPLRPQRPERYSLNRQVCGTSTCLGAVAGGQQPRQLATQRCCAAVSCPLASAMHLVASLVRQVKRSVCACSCTGCTPQPNQAGGSRTFNASLCVRVLILSESLSGATASCWTLDK